MMTLDEQIEILEAKKAGKDVEVRQHGCRWGIKHGNIFNFIDFEYRIKPEPMEFWMNIPVHYDYGFVSEDEAKKSISGFESQYKTIKFREVIE